MTVARGKNLLILAFVLYVASICLNQFFRADLIGIQKGPDIIQRIFGGFRDFAGDWAFIKVEEYNHGGMPFIKSSSYHKGGFEILEDRAGEGAHEDEAASTAQGEGRGLFSEIYSHIKITEHTHISGAQAKEVLPWFYLEVMFNPHDIRGYVVGAYWLHGLRREAECLAFLMEGEKNNPRSARIFGAIGEYYYRHNSPELELKYLERSCRLWIENKEPNIASEIYSELDRLSSFVMLGNLYESEGRYSKAMRLYGELYRMDHRPYLAGKIKAARLKLLK